MRRLFNISEGEIQISFHPGVWRRGALIDVEGRIFRVVRVQHDLRGPSATTLHVRNLYPWEGWRFKIGRWWRRTLRRRQR